MRVTVVQMNPGADKAANLAQAEKLTEAAIAADRPDLIALPEIWTCLGGDRETKFASAEPLPAPGSNEAPGPAYAFLQDLARRHRIHVHGGSIGEAAGETLFNTTVAFDPEGSEVARYRKIHLFDIVAPDGTGYRESATYGRGEEVVTYQANGVTVGCAICYDVRFPELFQALRKKGAELIMLPAAFTLQTGKDHWETLIRARTERLENWKQLQELAGLLDKKKPAAKDGPKEAAAKPAAAKSATATNGNGLPSNFQAGSKIRYDGGSGWVTGVLKSVNPVVLALDDDSQIQISSDVLKEAISLGIVTLR